MTRRTHTETLAGGSKPHPRSQNHVSEACLKAGLAETLSIMSDGIPSALFDIVLNEQNGQVNLSWSVLDTKPTTEEFRKVTAHQWREMRAEAKAACRELFDTLSEGRTFQLVADGTLPHMAAGSARELVGALNQLRDTYNVAPLDVSHTESRGR